MVTPEVKPYFGTVEEFLRLLQEHEITSICLVALCADEDTHDVVATWQAGPFETASAAGILQLHAALKYNEMNRGEEDEEE